MNDYLKCWTETQTIRHAQLQTGHTYNLPLQSNSWWEKGRFWDTEQDYSPSSSLPFPGHKTSPLPFPGHWTSSLPFSGHWTSSLPFSGHWTSSLILVQAVWSRPPGPTLVPGVLKHTFYSADLFSLHGFSHTSKAEFWYTTLS